MKLMPKVIVALAVFMTAVIAYAEVPDVSKWSCGVVGSNPDYGIEVMRCDDNHDDEVNFYIKASGELIYIHEHRMDANKVIYYNALKTNNGNFVEVVNKRDILFLRKITENKEFLMNIIDDNDNVVAQRLIPLLKK